MSQRRPHRRTGRKSPGRPRKNDERLVGTVEWMSNLTGLSKRKTRDLILALSEGYAVEPSAEAKQRHRDKLIRGFALITFELPHATFQGRGETLKRKGRKK
jgi:hypothetical protein